MKSRIIFFLIIPVLSFALSISGSCRFAAAADLPDTFRVGRIDIVGAGEVKKKKIKSKLAIVPPSFWRIWIQNPIASELDLAEDADIIAALYHEIGYYHVSVSYDADLKTVGTDDIPTARVTYTIEEGDPVMVRDVTVDTNGTQTDVSIRDILQNMPIQTGARFEEKAYRDSKSFISRKFGNEGHPYATVTGKVLIYPETNKADISFSIAPGPLCYFGETTVVPGSSSVNPKIIERSREYRTGEQFDTSKLDESQLNLYNLDIFKAAVVEPGLPDEETGQVPLSLSLKKKKKRSVKLGIGYGGEDGVRFRAGYTYRNPLDWAGKLLIEATRTDLLQKGSVGYNQPYFLDSRGALQTEAGIQQEFLDSYESRMIFGNVKYTRDLDYPYKVSLAYLLEYNDITDFMLADPEEIAAVSKNHVFLTSSLLGEIQRDTSDSVSNPERGSTLFISAEVASALFRSDLTYVNPAFEYKKYVKLPHDVVLATRFRAEAITDFENNEEIPVFKRLFLGGGNTVRGYAYQKLGPLDNSGNPIGGTTSMLANVEVRRPLFGKLSMVLFLDGGMLSQDRFSYDGDELRWGTGAGFRLGTPVGPIRLDLGYKLNPPETSATSDQPLEKYDRWRIHFNIGHTF